jgi:hypothetical protein
VNLVGIKHENGACLCVGLQALHLQISTGIEDDQLTALSRLTSLTSLFLVTYDVELMTRCKEQLHGPLKHVPICAQQGKVWHCG